MAFASWRTWLTGQVVTAAELNQDIRDNGNALFPNEAAAVAWSPGLAATGTGAVVSVTGRQYQVGAEMKVWARFVIGTSGGSGTYFVTLPVAAVGIAASASEGSGQVVGQWTIRDSSGPNSHNGSVLLRALDEVHFNAGPGLVSNVFPWQIQQNDVLSFNAVYPIA